jgi:universal stress protein A
MPIKKIVCCTDFSENAEAAFLAAVEMADKYDAKLFVIHVMPPVLNPLTDTEWMLPDESRSSLILKLEERMEQAYGKRIPESVECELIVLDGHVSTEILAYLKEHPADILIMGSYGLTGMGLVVFGSVAKRLSEKAPCSVMIVRG